MYAVTGMTKSVAIAYARENIRANVLSPGATDTQMFRGYHASDPEGAAAAERKLAQISPGRVNRPEVARAAVWALLDAPLR